MAKAPAKPAPINRAAFYASLRTSGAFGPTLSQTEVDGLEGILAAWEALGWPDDLRWVAYTIATAWHEARLNASIREGGKGAGKAYGRPAGPHGLVYYGRGLSQLTWLDNYTKFSKLVGVDLVKEPDRALDPKISAGILVVGSLNGLFRAGKSLKRYFSDQVDAPVDARDIINGDVAKHGASIAACHRTVLACLKAAVSTDAPAPPVVASPAAPPPLIPVERDAPASPPANDSAWLKGMANMRDVFGPAPRRRA